MSALAIIIIGFVAGLTTMLTIDLVQSIFKLLRR